MKNEIKQLARDIGSALYHFFSHRLLWLTVISILLFIILLVELFRLQVIEADTFRLTQPARTGTASRYLPALRGTIYDRHGRPLAVNELHFVVKMDPSVRISNEALLELAQLFQANNESFIDTFPIALPVNEDDDFTFTITGANDAQISNREYRFKADMAVPNAALATAAETWEFLIRQFDIDPDLSNEDIRLILNFRSMIFEQRFLGFAANYEPTPILFAYNVSQHTIAAIEEQSHFFSGLFVDIQAQRVYPAGRYVSHMIGYLRPITAAQLLQNEHLGYTAQDLFGRAGLELSMEHSLRGTPGRESFEINSAGRQISTPIRYVEPEPGSRIFLTIDLELQMAAFHALEYALTEAVIGRLSLRSTTEPALTLQDVFISFVNAHNLDLHAVLAAEEDCYAYPMRQYIIARFPDANANTLAARERMHSIISDGITQRRISPAMMLLTLLGTGQISDSCGTIAVRLQNPLPNTAQDILIEKMRQRELTPQLLNVDPATGSLIITCVHTGAVLAAATYPSFDNNRLVNNFDNDYWLHINSLDPTNPMINRPFREARAPGSTFKMFTAAAALEDGRISPNTRIRDGVNFTSAGSPSVRCWHRGGHGNITVAQAIAVSCNYFFAEAAFRLGDSGRNTLQGITTLNEYMAFFGLNSSSGVEIGDHPIDLRAMGFTGDTMASPDFKRHRYLQFNQFAPASSLVWTGGDTSQVSIGQGFNNYSAAQMVRGMSAIANRGVNYYLHLVSHTENFRGQIISVTTPTYTDTHLEFSDSTWDVIIEGMRLVTEPGASGTAVGAFASLRPYIRVAGKTGTAEEDSRRLSHSTFGAFAPYEDPQIAIFVAIPFGSTAAYRQISAQIARDMIAVTLGLHNQPEHPQPHNVLIR